MTWHRAVASAGLLLAAGCGRGAAGNSSQEGYIPLPTNPGQAAAAPDHQQVRQFWEVYQQATKAKQAGDWQAAVTGYQKALDLDPAHWDSLYYLGNSLTELHRFDEALQAYRKLASLDTKAARAYSALGALHSNPEAGKLFDLAEAERMYTKARGSNGDESGSVLRLGEVTLAEGKWPQAADYLEAAGRTNFKSVTARYLQGYLAWKSGSRDRAASLFRQAVDLTKEQKPPKGVLGEGDTKMPAQRAMVLPGSRSLFDGPTADLWTNRDADPARMDASYRRLDQFLGSLKGRTAVAHR